MTWGKSHMGIRRELRTCFCILVLLAYLLFENPCFAERSSVKRAASSSSSSSGFEAVKIHGKGQRGIAADKDNGNDVFGDQKRRVYTGANPLHNR